MSPEEAASRASSDIATGVRLAISELVLAYARLLGGAFVCAGCGEKMGPDGTNSMLSLHGAAAGGASSGAQVVFWCNPCCATEAALRGATVKILGPSS